MQHDYLYYLTASEKDVQWSEEGIISSYKFIQKLWNLNFKMIKEIEKNHQKDYDEEISKFTNKLIKKITENLESFSYNKIIANLYEMYSFLNKQIENNYSSKTLIENYQKVLIVMSPVMPHFTNECLSMINKNENLNWPSYDEKMLVENDVEIVVQINGKKEVF